MRKDIFSWREKIWQLIHKPIFEQVRSFNQLAYAITTLAQTQPAESEQASILKSKINQLSTVINRSLSKENDERMQQFLANSVNYLAGLPALNREIPLHIIRALRDVENILKIEQQPLSVDKQKLLNFYILQMARLSGENG